MREAPKLTRCKKRSLAIISSTTDPLIDEAKQELVRLSNDTQRRNRLGKCGKNFILKPSAPVVYLPLEEDLASRT